MRPLCLAVRFLIPAEERELLRVFGDAHRRYTERAHRLVPSPGRREAPRGRADAKLA